MIALVAAVLWPSHTLSALHGAPLDTRAGALVLGLAIPVLLWIQRRYLDYTLVRVAVIALAVVKLADVTLLTQQGLCAKSTTGAPFSTTVLTIPIDEPAGILRSWDVRADWRSETPACTAIVDRAYPDTSAFPAWFRNLLTDFDGSGSRRVAMDITGFARVRQRGLLVLEAGGDMAVQGLIDGREVSASEGRPLMTALEPGTHRLDLHAVFSGVHGWRLAPTFNGRDLFAEAGLTTRAPRGIDRAAGALAFLYSALVVLIVAGWIGSIAVEFRGSPVLLAWCVAAASVLAVLGTDGRFERFAVLLLAGAVFVPVAERDRQLRGVLLLVGVPWLALIAAQSLPQIARVTEYSVDDWLAYQVAGYRIFMGGFWLEGGNRVFDYQPLYRWISGAIHLVFGDSSVGETYWDGIWLLLGATTSFVVVNREAGFRWAVAAAVATLATFWLGTIRHFVGRGLSEIAAAGWGFLAALALVRNRSADVRLAVGAGICAVLMFYTRLNHLLFAVFLVALLGRFAVRPATAYLATFVAGVALFAARTWWYTGVFSILYGTSLKNNDTGLRLTTMGSAEVWGKIWHSLRALVWLNEPPSPDPRAIFVVAGVLLSIGTLLHLPRLNRLPLSLAIVTLGACASSLLAHTHNYPGRMSIHLAPFAVAMTAITGARLFAR
jgi:hypothetical protein